MSGVSTQVAISLIFNVTGFWNRLEMYCRELTKRWNEVHVISGPALRPTSEVDLETQQETKFVKYRVCFLLGGISRLDMIMYFMGNGAVCKRRD